MTLRSLSTIFVTIAFMVLSNQASAVSVYCFGAGEADCEVKAENALTNAGCQLSSEVVCSDVDESKVLCEVETENCVEPISELFGASANAVYCRNSNDERVNLKRIDRSLRLTWTFGLLRSYVRHICVK